MFCISLYIWMILASIIIIIYLYRRTYKAHIDKNCFALHWNASENTIKLKLTFY